MNWYKLENIKIRQNLNKKEILDIACKKYHLNSSDIEDFKILKKSIDARNKEDVYFNYAIGVKTHKNIKRS